MDRIKILWADDEIEMLKPQLLFLEEKGYEVTKVTNGHDALEEMEDSTYDVVFLDESMPGLTGLETLGRLRTFNSRVPVVMITKNEEEDLMEEALGSEITDYLIKPVNPKQILLSLKKIIDNKRLVQEKTAMEYQQKFREILMQINSGLSLDEWIDIYKKIVRWELKLDASDTSQMSEILAMQKQEANGEFSKFVKENYSTWIDEDNENRPVMSDTLMRRNVFPLLSEEKPVVMLLLDNCRYDQWKIIQPLLMEEFNIVSEDTFLSILPTTTQYSRNAIFSGMMPADIAKHYRKWWLNDNEEGGKNKFEDELLNEQVNRLLRREIKHDYFKVTNQAAGQELNANIQNYLNNDLTVIVYNFIDMLSHARTEMEVLKELASDEPAYRSLTRSWFLHSPLWDALRKISDRDFKLIVTTDHGTIRVNTPSKVIGDKETTPNLRYKVGRNLDYRESDVLDVKNPEKMGLPSVNVSSTYIFATEDRYFLYPNNYSYYNNYYRNTFQHGGISLEEMICPFMVLETK